MELLAPAGNTQAFYAGLGSGADALYLGVEVLNARRGADNVATGDVARLCRLAHLLEARVYLTLNTLILDEECVQATQIVSKASASGVDAVIVADLGLISHLKTELPAIRLHASTQLNCRNADTLRALADLGVARVTLARELSFTEIEVLAAVGREVGVEVEVFCHGALCVAASGQCLFSSLVGRRSANRGLCAQPCRLPYGIVDHKMQVHESKGPYVLSPKDLCGIDYLKVLEDAGVAAVKIEGRMKQPAYVAAVTSVYREVLDNGTAQGIGDRAILGNAFNRALTSGYLDGARTEVLMDYHRRKNSTDRSAADALLHRAEEVIAAVKSYRKALVFDASIEEGEPLRLVVTDRAGNSGSAIGEVVEAAHTKALNEDEVRTHLGRLGNTPYKMDALRLNLGHNVGLGFSALHRLRREAIADYESNRWGRAYA